MRTFTDEYLGITEQDALRFNVLCSGDKRCLILGAHTALDHLRLGLAEKLMGGK